MENSSSRSLRATRTVGTVLAVVFAVIGVLLVTLALLARTDEGGVTRVAGYPVLTVLSDSMTPTFKAGDMVVEGKVDGRADELRVGTAITFRASNGLVTHRIVRVNELSDGEVIYRTQGDANNMIDETPVKPEQIVGVYSWHVPSLGYVLEHVRSPLGMSLLILVPLLLLLAPLLAKFWREAGDEMHPALPELDQPEEALEDARVG